MSKYTAFCSLQEYKTWHQGFTQEPFNLCASEHNQHLIVLPLELSDCKWLFFVNSWLVHYSLLTGYNIYN